MYFYLVQEKIIVATIIKFWKAEAGMCTRCQAERIKIHSGDVSNTRTTKPTYQSCHVRAPHRRPWPMRRLRPVCPPWHGKDCQGYDSRSASHGYSADHSLAGWISQRTCLKALNDTWYSPSLAYTQINYLPTNAEIFSKTSAQPYSSDYIFITKNCSAEMILEKLAVVYGSIVSYYL